MMELPVDYSFSAQDCAGLQKALKSITVSPYIDYSSFDAAIDSLMWRGALPADFIDFCETRRDTDTFEDPYVVVRNCPIDQDLPFLDYDDPVNDKRNRKLTYVAEGFLLIYAKLMRQEPIGYANVNDGDIFQDIHPKKSLANSQSQKALKPIFFHKDLANHFVRPDWVNILGLRSTSANEVYTSFVRNKDLLDALGEDVCEALRCREFHTPYDDLTTHESNVKLGEADMHPILGGATSTDIRFFENRTRGTTEKACAALDCLVTVLHKLKKKILIQPGDLIGSVNNDCLHNKDVGAVTDPAALQNRWLIKTVNVRSLQQHQHHFIQNRPRIVNG